MKQIIKNFNNLIEKTIFKVKNKTNNNFQISNFNKYLITFITLLFFYLFYLSIPALYDKTWLQKNIESKLFEEFKINFSTSSDISYYILPAPHFLIKDSKILKDGSNKFRAISQIKNLKVFIKQNNFFDKEKINFKEIVIDNANFSLLKNDLKLLNNLSNNKFSNKKIKIKDSNFFIKDSLNETIFIVKIIKAFFFFDNKKLFNLLDLKGEVFNIPFDLDLTNTISSQKNKEINIFAKKLRINIFNESNREKKNFITGKNIISLFNSTINTQYNIQDNKITFVSINSIIDNNKVKYSGEISVSPFDLNLDINLGNFNLSKVLDFNSIFFEFINTGLLFNENITANTILTITSSKSEKIIKNSKINFNIVNGEINFNKTKFSNNKVGSIKVKNSSLFFKNEKLTLNADIKIDINDSNYLFFLLQTNKKYRKEIKNVYINLNYDFSTNQVEFNNIQIDKNVINDNLLKIIEDLNDINLITFNKSKRILNKLMQAYEG